MRNTPLYKTLQALLISLPLLVAAPDNSAQTGTDALYRALGSETGINLIVDDLMVLILADARIKDSFKETNIKRLSKLLKEQFCVIGGGPCNYTGDDMKLVHDKLGITVSQFNALVEDLQIAMEKHQIPSSVQNKLLAKLAPMKRDIVAPRVAKE
ncbi:group 1 truncated hemoglobin [Undibacterium sp. Jales W-56]|uniref:group I truncated hemoglobin n=1 Tax=Undibacterium sp. Jales W-56 TaxID=2897325 RepID=UPI0021CFFDE1|nr:group 1 truncated hemoglobin [Undibacterium sp. Jales W-56]MCU6434048.1 group 1 truncated hemoglobin [Undibacterium sp. Jales W-56]